MDANLLFVIPRSVLFVVTLAGAMLSFQLGFMVGRRRRAQHGDEEKTLGPMVTGVLGLVAFVLALTFSMAANRFDQRKQNVLNDANAISTAYLRAWLVSDPQGARIRELLEDYTDLRAHFAEHPDLHALLDTVQSQQIAIWKEVVALGETHPGPATASLAAVLTEVFDLHEKRVNDAVYNRLGKNVWMVLIGIVMLGLLMLGVQSGLAGRQSLIGLAAFAFALAAMITLIADLDNPRAGMFVVSQRPMVDTLASIRSYDAALEAGRANAP